MLETIRKHHYVLMCIVAAVVVVAFTMWPNRNDPMSGGGQTVMSLFGRAYTQNEVQAINDQGQIISLLVQNLKPEGPDSRYHQFEQYRDPLMRYYNTLSSVVNNVQVPDRLDPDFATNVLVMRDQCEKLGIAADTADVQQFMESLPVFQTRGKFDPAKYEKAVSPGPQGDRSLLETRVNTMLRDVLLYQKLSRLVGGELAPSEAELDHSYAQQNQSTTVNVALVDRKAHENQTVTDEEVQKFYDAEKTKPLEAPKKKRDAEESRATTAKDKDKEPEKPAVIDPLLLSEEKRTVKYVLMKSPVPPPAPVAPPPLNPDELKNLPEDQKKQREDDHKKKQDEHNSALAGHAKKKEADETQWLASVSAFSDALAAEARGNKSFEEMAKAAGLEVKTATFTKAAPPDDLKSEPGLTEQMFLASPGNDKTEKGTAGYCIFSVATIEKPAVVALDQVKEKLQEKLKKEKIDASLKAAADSAKANIMEALKGGKSFKEAAGANMLTVTEPPAFSSQKRLDDKTTPNSSTITTEAGKLSAGELSAPVTVPEGMLIVYVTGKELLRAADMVEKKARLARGLTMGADDGFGMSPLFQTWFTARRNEAQEAQDQL